MLHMCGVGSPPLRTWHVMRRRRFEHHAMALKKKLEKREFFSVDAVMSDELSAYELQRLANIAHNQSVLEKLNIQTLSTTKEKPRQSLKRKRNLSDEILPRRSSSRISNQPAMYGRLTDEDFKREERFFLDEDDAEPLSRRRNQRASKAPRMFVNEFGYGIDRPTQQKPLQGDNTSCMPEQFSQPPLLAPPTLSTAAQLIPISNTGRSFRYKCPYCGTLASMCANKTLHFHLPCGKVKLHG